MPKSSKAEARIVPVFRKSNLTDGEFLQEILARIMAASNDYVSKLDKRILETKTEDCEDTEYPEDTEDPEEGNIVNVRYVSRNEICTDNGVCSASAEISLC
jgi:hypothetical protein|tara:strand:+ start:35 stop:337 length:303 start_codon:yes stop_codon:yes gene_type:complete